MDGMGCWFEAIVVAFLERAILCSLAIAIPVPRLDIAYLARRPGGTNSVLANARKTSLIDGLQAFRHSHWR